VNPLAEVGKEDGIYARANVSTVFGDITDHSGIRDGSSAYGRGGV
jgi:hypothetical protein